MAVADARVIAKGESKQVAAIQKQEKTQMHKNKTRMSKEDKRVKRVLPTRGLHGSKKPTQTHIFLKVGPEPVCSPEKSLKCTTRTRRGPDHYSKVGSELSWEDTDPTAPNRHILHTASYY